MIRVGSYVWYHDRTSPLAIMDLFSKCDVVLLQRFPLKHKKWFGSSRVIENWVGHGMLTRGEGKIDVWELQHNDIEPNASQGRYIPVLKHPQVNIINCLTSYDLPGRKDFNPMINQLEQVMQITQELEGPTVICGDMHYEDKFISKFYQKYQLKNYMKANTFTNPRGNRISLDKILTTDDVEIKDIQVHQKQAHNRIEHYPFEFTINVK